MTPLEILAAAISGAPAPRIPVFCNLLDQGARELGMSQRDYYRKGEHVAAGQLQMRARYGHDNVWSLFYVAKEVEFFGADQVLFDDQGTPNLADYPIKSYDDIAHLEVPEDLTAHPAWEEIGACLKILKDEVGASHPICAYITASTSLPALLMGMESWLELLLTGPADARDELLNKCSQFFRQEIAAYRAGGANVIVYSTPFGSTSFIGIKRFGEFSLPWMARDLDGLGVSDLVYYCGTAPFNNVISQVREQLGIRIYYISSLDGLTEAKQLIGAQGLTCGVIDDISMIGWNPEQTRAEVRRMCEIGMVGGHFLLGTGVMPMAVPEGNIRALVAAAHEFGRYL